MQGVVDRTTLIANSSDRTIRFFRNASAFRELYAFADGGIWVEQDLNTTDGVLSLMFYHGDLNLSQHVDLIANGGDLILKSDGPEFIAVETWEPGPWNVINETGINGEWSMHENIITESSGNWAGNSDGCSEHRFGSMAIIGNVSWADYSIKVKIKSESSYGTIGIVYRYVSETDFSRILFTSSCSSMVQVNFNNLGVENFVFM